MRGVRRIVAVSLVAVMLLGCAVQASRQVVALDGASWTVLRDEGDGMRGRTGFDGADGMLFDLGGPTDPSAVVFVMDGVTIPLDIAWFGDDGALVGTASMLPCPGEPCDRHAAPGPFRWAIEAPPGAFADLPSDAVLDLAP